MQGLYIPHILVQRYMELFYGGKELEKLMNIFHTDLHFQGPFFSSHSAKAYVDSLLNDPPIGCSYELIKSYIDEDSVFLLYYFEKSGIRTPMSQLFKFEAGKIREILLVFDGRVFGDNSDLTI